jgi:hypothetical protein
MVLLIFYLLVFLWIYLLILYKWLHSQLLVWLICHITVWLIIWHTVWLIRYTINGNTTNGSSQIPIRHAILERSSLTYCNILEHRTVSFLQQLLGNPNIFGYKIASKLNSHQGLWLILCHFFNIIIVIWKPSTNQGLEGVFYRLTQELAYGLPASHSPNPFSPSIFLLSLS